MTKKADRSGNKPLFASKAVTKQTPGHAVDINVDITGTKQLYLVVTDGGNGFGCDWANWANWAEPRLTGPAGELKLTELKWTSASSGFGQVQLNKNTSGQPMKIDGKAVAYGIGTHANSVIAYDVPAGYNRFQARGGLDNGGTDQGNCGETASVEFQVYNGRPPASEAGNFGGSRDAADALDGLKVGEGLTASLFAAEPQLLSPSNIDIDHLGRVWVCEVVNYRKHKGKRPKGDRILILEDTDGDGQVDREKVYYQGTDIDSPHGVCVLGNKVIVSAGDKVQVFTDTNDGNKGVRINYVMEFGNYGYKDERTGAGWKSARTGMSNNIPEKHWHLNDPGVVPNLLQTGAGSPTGITIYEGDLLPMFRGHVLHCDAGPNVCRAYITGDDGAGYKAEIRDILTGVQDKRFRPSDVKIAPDGSLVIADWYDPGVGGHGMGDLNRGRLFRIVPLAWL